MLNGAIIAACSPLTPRIACFKDHKGIKAINFSSLTSSHVASAIYIYRIQTSEHPVDSLSSTALAVRRRNHGRGTTPTHRSQRTIHPFILILPSFFSSLFPSSILPFFHHIAVSKQPSSFISTSRTYLYHLPRDRTWTPHSYPCYSRPRRTPRV